MTIGEIIILVVLILISLGANAAYSTPDHHYDWFFTTGSSFGINETIMPFIIFGVFFGLDMVIYLVCYLVNKFLKKEAK